MKTKQQAWMWTLGLALGLTMPALAQEQPPGASPLQQRLTVEARTAGVREFITRLSSSLDVPMTTSVDYANRRVTLRATDVSLSSLQQALAALYQSRWQQLQEGNETRFRLVDSVTLEDEAEALRLQRRRQFLTRLQELEQQLRRRQPATLAQLIRTDMARRLPGLDEGALSEITPAFVNQVLLLSPERLQVAEVLAQNGQVWVPLWQLAPVEQQLFAQFFVQRSQTQLAALQRAGIQEVSYRSPVINPRVLFLPQSRLEYRFLYGDHWTGDFLLGRVGIPDQWASAALPSTMFTLPDYATLYPQTQDRVEEPALLRPVANLTIDPNTENWDQALIKLSRNLNINVLSDAYLRPPVFGPTEEVSPIIGSTVGDTLDRVAQHYGYVWWKQGDWYIFRNRMWAEQERVTVPEAVTQNIASSIASEGYLSRAALAGLASLNPEQLLSLHLFAEAAGQASAPRSAFDLEQIELAQAGLLLYSQLDDEQRTLARGQGLPVLLMNTNQQTFFSTLAAERGLTLTANNLAGARLGVAERYDRERLPTGWAEVGSITFTFNFLPGVARRAELAIRVPAVERPSESTQASE